MILNVRFKHLNYNAECNISIHYYFSFVLDIFYEFEAYSNSVLNDMAPIVDMMTVFLVN